MLAPEVWGLQENQGQTFHPSYNLQTCISEGKQQEWKWQLKCQVFLNSKSVFERKQRCTDLCCWLSPVSTADIKGSPPKSA